ncbi:MAG TPA: outer membrane lipoprotein carrier protein LolA [Longimicrobiales bacterium]|nr:outer membrane lipoprotein carrier protein LolA [Longimicrobiales bacterium]
MRSIVPIIAVLGVGTVVACTALRYFQAEATSTLHGSGAGPALAAVVPFTQRDDAALDDGASPGDIVPDASEAPGAPIVETSSVRDDAPEQPGSGQVPLPGSALDRSAAPGDAGAGLADATEADPEAILRGAASAYAGLQSMRAEFTQTLENAFLRRTFVSRGTLYQKRPDKLLMQFTDPAGDILVSDGTHFWVYYPSADPNQVIRTSAAAGAGVVDLQAQFVGDPVARFEYSQRPSERVGGRESHVFLLVPRDPEAGYRSLQVWLDPADLLARRFEITELNGNVRRIDLESIEINPTIPDSLFRFVPPEGVRVVDR